MLVKIMRYNGEQQYWLYDNVSKISVSNRRYHSHLPQANDINLAVFDIDSKCTCGDGEAEGVDVTACSNCVTYFRLILRFSNGDEYSIAFDTIAYILNDEGKTIEKIVANYYPEEQIRTGRWQIYETGDTLE